jgi:hypothetical protein
MGKQRDKKTRYRCIATSRAGFFQQLSRLLRPKEGYFYAVQGEIPDGKDPRKTDRRIIEEYSLGVSRWTNARAKKHGRAKVQYLRFERSYVKLATPGDPQAGAADFREREKSRLKDLRETSLHLFGHSVGMRGGKPHIRIGERTYRRLLRGLKAQALRLSREELEERLHNLPFEPFAPVAQQFKKLLFHANLRRRAAGLPPARKSCLRLRCRSVRVFDPPRPPGKPRPASPEPGTKPEPVLSREEQKQLRCLPRPFAAWLDVPREISLSPLQVFKARRLNYTPKHLSALHRYPEQTGGLEVGPHIDRLYAKRFREDVPDPVPSLEAQLLADWKALRRRRNRLRKGKRPEQQATRGERGRRDGPRPSHESPPSGRGGVPGGAG